MSSKVHSTKYLHNSCVQNHRQQQLVSSCYNQVVIIKCCLLGSVPRTVSIHASTYIYFNLHGYSEPCHVQILKLLVVVTEKKKNQLEKQQNRASVAVMGGCPAGVHSSLWYRRAPWVQYYFVCDSCTNLFVSHIFWHLVTQSFRYTYVLTEYKIVHSYTQAHKHIICIIPRQILKVVHHCIL